MAVDMINQGISKTTTVNNNATATPKADEKKPVSKTVIGASLVGLAALASVGIYLATKGKGKVKPQELVDEVKNPTNNTQLEELQKQAGELKDKIRIKYKDELHKKNGPFIKDRGPTDKYAYKQLDKDQKEMQELLDKNEPIAKEFSSRVRNSVKALQNDPDCKELLRLRHQYKKECLHSSKLALINEVIYTKINNGQKTPYFEELGLSVEDAIRLIKDKSLNEQEVYKEMIKNRVVKSNNGADIMNPHLMLHKLFVDGDKGIDALHQVQRARKYLDGKVAETTAQRIRDVRVNVAQEIRQSDDVKSLKELNRQIAELKKNTPAA